MNNKVKKICLTGLMAALITVCTAFIKIPTGINSGYLHFGDSMIYIAPLFFHYIAYTFQIAFVR